jgi:hypothetical protein
MKTRVLAILCAVGSFSTPAFSQRVDPNNLHERVYAVVPMSGKGTYDDPIRPLFAPTLSDLRKPGAIHSFSYQLSDDGKYALVEFVALDRAALVPILNDARTLKAFEKGKHKLADIERELRRFKQNFSLNRELAPRPAR